jgi:alpha-glucosidase
MNYEYNKWGKVMPDHDILVPFTRMIAGPTDYHLGGFRAATPASFQTQYSRPVVMGTRCHMLAMYVVLENYLNMIADFPAAYEGKNGFEFIASIPTVWDETKVVDEETGKFIVVARRKGNNWYVGAITGSEPRSGVLSYDFLEEKTYQSEIYLDSDKSIADPNELQKQFRSISKSDTLNFMLVPGGGMAMKITMN